MTDPIVIRGPRKSVLRKRFREIQREHGAGAIVAFANGKSRAAQECLRGLMETGSITDPVYSREGFAVVKIVQDLDGDGIPGEAVGVGSFSDQAEAENFIAESQVAGDDATNTAPDTEQPTASNPAPGDVYQENVAGETTVDTSTDEKTPPVPEDGGAQSDQGSTPPPTSGPGSGADAWRSYAADVTGSPYESWAALGRQEIIDLLRSEGVLD